MKLARRSVALDFCTRCNRAHPVLHLVDCSDLEPDAGLCCGVCEDAMVMQSAMRADMSALASAISLPN